MLLKTISATFVSLMLGFSSLGYEYTEPVPMAEPTPEPVASGEPAYSAEDVELLAELIYAEAGNQPLEGKYAVATVVINRLEAGYGKTLRAVIYAPNQFAAPAKGTNDQCREVAENVLNNGARTLPPSVVNFQRANVQYWRRDDHDYNLVIYTRIGAHTFYRNLKLE